MPLLAAERRMSSDPSNFGGQLANGRIEVVGIMPGDIEDGSLPLRDKLERYQRDGQGSNP